MGRWETVNTAVRLLVESCLKMGLVTSNLHVHYFTKFQWSGAVGLGFVRSIQWIYIRGYSTATQPPPPFLSGTCRPLKMLICRTCERLLITKPGVQISEGT